MADTRLPEKTGTSATDARAAAFVAARLSGSALAAYPGPLPASAAEAYEIQRQAINLWPDRVAGWKVGRISLPWDAQFGTDRLAGPIFARQILRAGPAAEPALIFANGFGAVEGEIVIELNANAPAGKVAWTLEEAAAFVGAVRLGIEIASSPFAGINDHGPLVTISDFGNNNGLILGGEIAGWREAVPSDWRLRTVIDGVEAGAADASSIPGGPLESFRAVLGICARNGLPLQQGMHISTGAVTGIHPVRPGQSARVEMAGLPAISCTAGVVMAHPAQSSPA